MNESSRPQRSLIRLETPMGVFDVYLARRLSRVRLVVVDRNRAPRATTPARGSEGTTGGRRRRGPLGRRPDDFGLQVEPVDGGLAIRLLLRPAEALRPALPLAKPPAKAGKPVAPTRIRLQRCELNPILMPRAQVEWEALAVFNSAAVVVDGRVHLIYRAIGWDGSSVFGHACTADGVHIDEQSGEPIFSDDSTLAGYVGSGAECSAATSPARAGTVAKTRA